MISVSFLKSIYPKEKTIEMIDKLDSVEYIHVDLSDGIYAGDNNINLGELKDIFKGKRKKIDVHLMVKDPDKYLDDLSDINPNIITFHPDATDDPKKVIKLIKEMGCKVGLAINYDIEVDEYEELYRYVDLILIMSIQAGYGGQEFKKDVISKIEYFTCLKDDGEEFLLEIDGGINDENYSKLQKYPIDIFVIGSYICSNENFERPIKKLIK